MNGKSKVPPDLSERQGEFLQIEATEFEFKELVIVNGCSEKASDEIWKWYTKPQLRNTRNQETE